MPYPNEHACRLRDPKSLNIVGSEDRESNGKKYRVIFGKPKSGGGGSVEQAYRYPVGSWTADEARAHCRAHNGISFEAAAQKDQEFTDPLDNDFIKTDGGEEA